MPTYKKVIHADDNISELTNNSGYLTSVSTSNIASGAVTTDKLAANSVDRFKIASGQVRADAIGDEAVTAGKLASGCIDHPSKLANAVVGNAALDNGSVDRFKLASGAVRSANLDDLSVSTAKIQSDAVTSDKIADDAVTNAKLANGSVRNDQIVDGQVSLTKLASNSVNSTKIADSSITTAKIVDDSVTNSKIADEAIDNNKLADNAVLSGHIASDAITNAKVANGAIQLYEVGTNNSGSSGDVLAVAGGGTGLFWQTKTSLASDLSTYASMSKSYMHFCHNFYDDISIYTHYLPWNTGNETTTALSSNSSFLVGDTMTLKKILIKPMQFNSTAFDLTVRVYKASNNGTSFTQQSTATVSFAQFSNYNAQIITSMTPTVVSGEHIAIYIDASSDPGGTIHWQATSIWEVDRIGL